MNTVVLVWPGGEHEFALRLGELEALQIASDSGPGEVLLRLHTSMADANPLVGPWRISDVIDTIRLGLIGGGMDGIEARNQVRKAVERHGIPDLIPTAAEALLFSLSPRADEDGDIAPGEAEGAETPRENGTSEAS